MPDYYFINNSQMNIRTLIYMFGFDTRDVRFYQFTTYKT